MNRPPRPRTPDSQPAPNRQPGQGRQPGPNRRPAPGSSDELRQLQIEKAQLEVELLRRQVVAAGGTLPDKRPNKPSDAQAVDTEARLRRLEKQLDLGPDKDPKTGTITAKESQVATVGTAAAVKSKTPRGPVPLPTGGGMKKGYNPTPVGTQLRDGRKAVTITPAGVQVPRKLEQTQQVAGMHDAFWNGLSDDTKQAWQNNEISWTEKGKMQQVHAAEFLNKPGLDPRSPLERAAAGGSLGFAWSEEAGTPEPVVSDPQPAKGPGHTWSSESMKIDTGPARPSLKDRFVARRARRASQPALDTPKIDSLDLTTDRVFEAPAQPAAAEPTLVAPATVETEPVEPVLSTPKIDALDLTRDPDAPRPQAPAKDPTPLELAAQQGSLHWSEENPDKTTSV